MSIWSAVALDLCWTGDGVSVACPATLLTLCLSICAVLCVCRLTVESQCPGSLNGACPA